MVINSIRQKYSWVMKAPGRLGIIGSITILLKQKFVLLIVGGMFLAEMFSVLDSCCCSGFDCPDDAENTVNSRFQISKSAKSVSKMSYRLKKFVKKIQTIIGFFI